MLKNKDVIMKTLTSSDVKKLLAGIDILGIDEDLEVTEEFDPTFDEADLADVDRMHKKLMSRIRTDELRQSISHSLNAGAGHVLRLTATGIRIMEELFARDAGIAPGFARRTGTDNSTESHGEGDDVAVLVADLLQKYRWVPISLKHYPTSTVLELHSSIGRLTAPSINVEVDRKVVQCEIERFVSGADACRVELILHKNLPEDLDCTLQMEETDETVILIRLETGSEN